MATRKDAGKYKLTLSLEPAFARKFAAFSGFTGEDMSEIATRAIKRELRGFQVRRTDPGDDQADGSETPAVRLARPDDQREAG